MKILFATGFLEKNLNANNKIVSNLAMALSQKGHDCVVAGISEFDRAGVSEEGNLKKVYINSSHICDRAFLELEQFIKTSGLQREERRKKFILKHPVFARALYYKYNFAGGQSFSASSYAKGIDSIITQWQPDVMVAAYFPFEHALKAAEVNRGRCRLIAYQLDPWGLHRGDELTQNRETHIQQELELFSLADDIVTTPVLLSQYEKDERYARFADKMTALNFPCFENPQVNDKEMSVFSFDKKDINILFSGTINDDNRNPDFLLKVLGKAREENKNIKAYFLGVNDSAALKKRRAENDWIVCHENVSAGIARRTIRQCDVLLNISNIYDNQVPSKIFEYFAAGKPILNIEKIENCPARQYIDRYPLSFTLCEWDDKADIDMLSDRLCRFLKENKGRQADYKLMREIFYDCTVEYACDIFSSLIQG